MKKNLYCVVHVSYNIICNGRLFYNGIVAVTKTHKTLHSRHSLYCYDTRGVGLPFGNKRFDPDGVQECTCAPHGIQDNASFVHCTLAEPSRVWFVCTASESRRRRRRRRRLTFKLKYIFTDGDVCTVRVEELFELISIRAWCNIAAINYYNYIILRAVPATGNVYAPELVI